jgi:8-oxo-dGTP pyrophosphatase MutT (NUDIX family)
MEQDQRNPWVRKSTKVVYDNSWIRVNHDEVITPGGTKGIYGRVHMKNYAIGILPIDQDGNTWLVGQYRYTPETYSWEIPMGGGLLEQDPLESAKRELLEETGITAATWQFFMKLHTTNSISDEIGLVYVARDLTFGKPQFEDTEKIKIKKIRLQEAYQWALDGKITDSISVAALLKAAILPGF